MAVAILHEKTTLKAVKSRKVDDFAISFPPLFWGRLERKQANGRCGHVNFQLLSPFPRRSLSKTIRFIIIMFSCLLS